MRWIIASIALVACGGGDKDPDCKKGAWYVDDDGDGFGAGDRIEGCVADQGPATADVGGDCDDANAAVYPDADELCNGIDDDCDGGADDADTDDVPTDAQVFYADADGDGFGDADTEVLACTVGPGVVADTSDCDDTVDTTYPGAEEYCNEVDDDCNGAVDDDAVDVRDYYVDADGDQYGEVGTPSLGKACVPPKGTAFDPTDCEDDNAAVNPGAGEWCNGYDDDCDLAADDDDPDSIPHDATIYWADVDGDTFGDGYAQLITCIQPVGSATQPGDCDDGDGDTYPGAPEPCDDVVDRNCDGFLPTDDTDSDGVLACVDCDDDDASVGDPSEWFYDGDFDGWGAGEPVLACRAPYDHVAVDGDCDDNDDFVSPDGFEECDDIDNDCNGLIDEEDPYVYLFTVWTDADGDGFGLDGTEMDTCDIPPDAAFTGGDCDDDDDQVGVAKSWYTDADDDGYGDPTAFVSFECFAPPDTVSNFGDCDDTDPVLNPTTTWYRDDDADGRGAAWYSTVSCTQPPGYVLDDTDCHDHDPLVYPGRFDFADGVDNDCDDEFDEDVGNESTTAADVQVIVDAKCATCHTTGSSGGLQMTDVWAATVDVPSTQLPVRDRIEPGLPDASYLFRKLLGTHTTFGGTGNAMPNGGPPLSTEELAVWETWILEGAVDAP